MDFAQGNHHAGVSGEGDLEAGGGFFCLALGEALHLAEAVALQGNGVGDLPGGMIQKQKQALLLADNMLGQAQIRAGAGGDLCRAAQIADRFFTI